MGYEISYGPKISVKKRKKLWPAIAAVILLIMLLGVRMLWPEAAVQATRLLLPSDSGTQEAFQGMVESVRAGENLGDAVTAFCRQIIENAELPNAA